MSLDELPVRSLSLSLYFSPRRRRCAVCRHASQTVLFVFFFAGFFFPLIYRRWEEEHDYVQGKVKAPGASTPGALPS